ncbi:FAD binding domain-containing protein [Roseovarius sp. ZX-A-9]|uniref:FAD binding domain-containing protein n=1 Tax=Roseovarius sp. ZX-A-9 TaxID=3014783 RepID=UPI00232CA3BF|nr:FAD binding domain-containing protein [Roseovarius sp. ZX-A-9]
MDSANTDALFLRPTDIKAALVAMDGGAVPVAGGTWVMRASLRGDSNDQAFVSLSQIDALHEVAEGEDFLRIGALVTHDHLADFARNLPELGALTQAAGMSANPAIRRTATIGGNICARGFTAADLVPALLALNATVEVHSSSRQDTTPIAEYLQARTQRRAAGLLTTISVPRKRGHSAHARALLRKAGEYPIANISAFIDMDANNTIKTVRIAVGAVEAMPKRWHSLEKALLGQPFSADAADMARDLLDDFTPRDSVDAPDWYRLRVLPGLVRQAFASITDQSREDA